MLLREFHIESLKRILLPHAEEENDIFQPQGMPTVAEVLPVPVVVVEEGVALDLVHAVATQSLLPSQS